MHMLYKSPKSTASPGKKFFRKILFWAVVVLCLWLLASTWPHNPVALLLQAFFNANHTNPFVQIFCPFTHLVCR
jgi:hypothetical protein